MPPDAALLGRIVVVGSGIAALSAALALRRFVPGATVVLIETPVDPDDPIEIGTRLWPIADAFHARIGVTPAMLLRSAEASVHAADRFERWSGEPWLLPTDCRAVDGMVFQHWLRDRGGALTALMPEATLGERDRVAPGEDQSLRIDPDAYRSLLSRGLDASGAERVAVAEFGVERDAAGVAAALIVPGGRIAADWFVDTVGALAGTFGASAGATPEACDLVAVGRAEPPRWSAIDRWTATANGWIARMAGVHTSRTIMGFASASTDTDQAARAFRTETGHAPDRVMAIASERRDGWTRNVLAVGKAAIGIDPIGGLGLALAQSALLRVGELLPTRACAAIETTEFNRRTRAEHDAACDFIALHYHAATRAGPFWDRARALPLSDELARLLDQFTRRGRIPHRDDDLVPEAHWRALLTGTGKEPAEADALTRSLDPRVSSQQVAAARAHVAAAQDGAIPYRAWHDAQLRRPA